MPRGLVTALRTLSILPVPGRDAERFSDSLYWFPFAGFLLGVLQAALGYTGNTFGWPELSALLVVLGGIALTRGLHADGLADFADGFWGGKTREAALRIMKDPQVGSFGVLALVAVMGMKWVLLLQLLHHDAFNWIVAGIMLSRWIQVPLAVLLPYARKEGGTAASFVEGSKREHLVFATIIMFLLLFSIMGFQPFLALLAGVATLLAGTITGFAANRKLGGVTGDVLGAASELTEVAVWFAGALFFR
ncbi:adenosylcobinamide-GDP ribazoletransferase [Chlorobium phaeobacteroides]|nr:adenosylcobinamide-GDP ribazoletransferase [Chlorobium phaeobacteroides]